MSTADHATCCCQDTLTERTALLAAYGAATARADAMEARIKDTLGERDRARNLAARLEDQLAQVAIANGMIDDNHYDAPAAGTPATEEARKSAESDADDDAEWDAREAIERARGWR